MSYSGSFTLKTSKRRKPALQDGEVGEPHPLEATILAMFDEHKALAICDVAIMLGAVPGLFPDAAYTAVAEDAMMQMAAEGKLYQGDDAHFRLGVVGSLASESEARRGCRVGLAGLTVRRDDGLVGRISATRWDEHGQLEVSLEQMGGYAMATRFRLLDRWPVRCCRPFKPKRTAPRRR